MTIGACGSRFGQFGAARAELPKALLDPIEPVLAVYGLKRCHAFRVTLFADGSPSPETLPAVDGQQGAGDEPRLV